jgi:hypothetical protein
MSDEEGPRMFRTTIVYESMFGETRRIAEAIALGLSEAATPDDVVTLRRVGEVTPEDVASADLLVVGGPTHAHSMSRPKSRIEAEKWSQDPQLARTLEPGATVSGIREFVRDLPATNATFATFDTRADAPEIFTGSAARAIAKRLAKKGLEPLMPPQTFAVTKAGPLLEGEAERATALGHALIDLARRRERTSAH